MKKFLILTIIFVIIQAIIIFIWILNPKSDINFEGISILFGLFIPFLSLVIKYYNLNTIKNESIISKNKYKNDKIRTVEKSCFVDFIKILPNKKINAYKEAQKKLDSEITVEMREGSSDIIEFLIDSWIQISDFYDNDIFDNEIPKDYIDKFIKNRYRFHWAKYLPEGGNGLGSMYGVIVDAEVISDIEREVLSLINAIGMVSDNIDSCKIINEWNEV